MQMFEVHMVVHGCRKFNKIIQCSSDISKLRIRVLYARILRIRVSIYAYTRMSIRVYAYVNTRAGFSISGGNR